MTIGESLLDRLVDAGLTQYEARAYLVLRNLGPARVTQIARASGVPRNKLYGALAQLEKMGLAETRGTEPLTYVTRSLSPFLQARITRLESLLGELGDSAVTRTLTPVTAGADPERGASTWVP